METQRLIDELEMVALGLKSIVASRDRSTLEDVINRVNTLYADTHSRIVLLKREPRELPFEASHG